MNRGVHMAKLYANFGILVLAALLGGCGNSGSGSGEETADNSAELPEFSLAEVNAATKSLESKEKDLKEIGIDLSCSQKIEGKNLRTNCQMDEAFLQNFIKNRPTVTYQERILRLGNYIESIDQYLSKYEKFSSGDQIYTIKETAKAEFETKRDLAKKIIARFLPEIEKEKAAKEKADRERRDQEALDAQKKREQEARDALLPVYTDHEYYAEINALEEKEKKLKTKGISLYIMQALDAGKPQARIDFRLYFDEQAKTRSRQDVKAELIIDTQVLIDHYSAFAVKYGSYPYFISDRRMKVRIDESPENSLWKQIYKINESVSLAKLKVVELYNAIEQIDQR